MFTPFQIGSKRYAWGLAAGYKNTGLGGGAPDKAAAEVEVYPDGTAEIRTSSAEMGQNLVGVLAACTAEELGLPFQQVSVLVMDTDLSPDGGPTTASRQTFVSGNAARLAARSMRERLQTVLAEKFDVPPDAITFHEGLAYVDDTRLASCEKWREWRVHADGTRHLSPVTASPLLAHHFLCRRRGCPHRRGTGAEAALRVLGAQDPAAGYRRRYARGLLLRRPRGVGERGCGDR